MNSNSGVVELRKKMVGLPLQRSIFDRLDTLGSVIGLASVLRDGRFNAMLDTQGSLHVDQSDMAALIEAFPTKPDDPFLVHLESERRSRCAALLRATDRAREATAIADEAHGLAAATELLDRLADFVPYPILTKIVPELLHKTLVAQGAMAIPSAPTPSPGMRLTLDLECLASWCWANGFSASDLADTWPDVPANVDTAVRLFCGTHTGFGPVAWEAPGFDSARHVVLAISSLEGGHPTTDTADLPSFSHITPELDRPAVTLAGALEGWLELTDLQIWYVRTAFYRGLVPLLEHLGPRLGIAPERLLFVTRHELGASIPDEGVIDERVAVYDSDTAYLERGSISNDRLTSLFREASCPSR